MRSEVAMLQDDFKKHGPFKGEISVSVAMNFLSSVQKRIIGIENEDERIRKGLLFFHVDPSPIKELANLRNVSLL